MPAKYHFISSYRLSGDIDAVWDVLMDVDSWPSWWRWQRRIEQVQPAASDDGVGAAYRNYMTSPLGTRFSYVTTITAVERHRQIDIASTGDLQGIGRFSLAQAPDGVLDLTYTWLVETPKWWMSALAVVGRPAFGWNHDRLMDDFGRGLAKTARVKLIEGRNVAVRPGAPGFHEMPAASSAA